MRSKTTHYIPGLLGLLETGLLLTVALHGEVKVLKNFTMIDGSGRQPMAGTALIMENGRIRWTGPVERPMLLPPLMDLLATRQTLEVG